MSRQSIANDIAAQICWNYIHGGYDEETNEKIYYQIHSIIPNRDIAIRMLLEIAYRIWYANSLLADYMSEVTYKIKKKQMRDKLVSLILEISNENTR